MAFVFAFLGFCLGLLLASLRFWASEKRSDYQEIKNVDIEKDLEQSRKFLRAVIDQDPNLIFVKDREGRFTLVNQALAKAYGTSPEEIIGKTDADFNDNQAEVEHFRQHDLRVIDHGEELFIPEEVVTDAAGNVRKLQTIKRPLKLGPDDDTKVLGVAIDITRQKELQSQLAHSQKMEAVGQLAGGIAHDFNNLLTGIMGYAALVKREGLSLKERETIGDKLEAAADRASDLTQKLLGFARKGKHRNIPIDLHSVIEETTAMLRRVFPENISIQQTLTPSPIVIKGDPTQIQQVVLNLAINARDAMTEAIGGSRGGELLIETKLLEQGGKNLVSVEFSDTGCGIPKDVQRKIFEPFFTTKPMQRGSGMGLAMVYGIVENHGGEISFNTKMGKGTVFKLLLPAASLCEALHVTTEHKKVVRGEGRILIVDDNELVLNASSDMLSILGYQVEKAIDGWKAIKIIKELKGEIDLVILDMVMPEMGAEEVFYKLRKIDPNVRVALSTGYEANESVQRLLDLGMEGFIAKPYEISSLSQSVAEILNPELPKVAGG